MHQSLVSSSDHLGWCASPYPWIGGAQPSVRVAKDGPDVNAHLVVDEKEGGRMDTAMVEKTKAQIAEERAYNPFEDIAPAQWEKHAGRYAAVAEDGSGIIDSAETYDAIVALMQQEHPCQEFRVVPVADLSDLSDVGDVFESEGLTTADLCDEVVPSISVEEARHFEGDVFESESLTLEDLR